MKTRFTLTLLTLSICLLAHASLRAQIHGVTPVPAEIEGYLDGAQRPRLQWRAVSGHGSQDGLITNAAIYYDEYATNYGTDQPDWELGDPSESRRANDGTHTNYLSSYGADIIFFNGRGGPDNEADIYCLREFGHTPLPYWPSPVGGDGEKAKFDQIHYFNANPSTSRMDMIDLSSLGVTHPDQLLWFPGEGGYQYSYLMIDDNDGDFTDVAAAVLIRSDRTFGAFSLTENIIYAEGQTTYNVYRRPVGSPQYQQIATGLTDSIYVDTDPLPAGQSFEYVITATAMFGESKQTQSTIVSIPGSLPVEWLSFDATVLATGAVQLDWATAQEHNSDRFEVERSVDGRSFTHLGSVAAAGQATEISRYQYLDAQPPRGTVYYRLRQVDWDGRFHYSELRQATPQRSAAPAVQLYPNPATEVVMVRGLIPGESYRLRIVDPSGRTLQQVSLSEQPSSEWSLSLGALKPGLYQILVEDPEQTFLLSLPLLRT